MGKHLDRLGPYPSLLMQLDGATPHPNPMPRRNATTDRITFHKQKPIKQRKLEARLKGLRWHKWHYHLKSY